MVVVTGIITAIKIATRVIPIIYKGGKKIKPAAQFFDRHKRTATIATTAAATAPLIYDLLNIDYDALLPKQRQPGKTGQTRDNVYGTSYKRGYNKKYQYLYGRRCRIKSRTY